MNNATFLVSAATQLRKQSSWTAAVSLG